MRSHRKITTTLVYVPRSTLAIFIIYRSQSMVVLDNPADCNDRNWSCLSMRIKTTWTRRLQPRRWNSPPILLYKISMWWPREVGTRAADLVSSVFHLSSKRLRLDVARLKSWTISLWTRQCGRFIIYSPFHIIDLIANDQQFALGHEEFRTTHLLAF